MPNHQLLNEMEVRTGGRMLSQILINGRPIGGSTELVELDKANQPRNLC